MGGIAAIDSDERSWFIYALSNVSCGTWEKLKAILKQFLWLGSTSDSDAMSLWLETMKVQSLFGQMPTPSTMSTNSTATSELGIETTAEIP